MANVTIRRHVKAFPIGNIKNCGKIVVAAVVVVVVVVVAVAVVVVILLVLVLVLAVLVDGTGKSRFLT